jgi:hypothetical protein
MVSWTDDDVVSWELLPASALEVRRVRWLWDRRVPLGGVTLLPGREGLGKSTVAHEIAARVSRGQLDGDLAGTPADVVLVGLEDMLETVSAPRLRAAGADLTRVWYVRSRAAGAVWSVPGDDLELETLLGTLSCPRLVVVDPLDAHLAADTHKKAETQRAIGTLAAIAQTWDLAVLGVAHHSKAPTTDPLLRVSGSTAFTSAARAVLTIAPHPDDERERVIVLSKANLTAREDVPPLRFRVEARVVESPSGPVDTSGIAWCGIAEGLDPDRVLDATDPDDRCLLDDAIDFLRHALAGGPQPSRELKRRAAAEGISDTTLKRARRALSVVVDRSGWPSETHWMLPLSSRATHSRAIGHGPTGAAAETRHGGGIGADGPSEPSQSGHDRMMARLEPTGRHPQPDPEPVDNHTLWSDEEPF